MADGDSKSVYLKNTLTALRQPWTYLHVQDLLEAREVEVSRVPTETNLAGIGTTHMPSHRSEFFESLMGKSSENTMTFRARMMLTRCESMETVGTGRRVNQNSQEATRESKSAMSLITASDDKDRRTN